MKSLTTDFAAKSLSTRLPLTTKSRSFIEPETSIASAISTPSPSIDSEWVTFCGLARAIVPSAIDKGRAILLNLNIPLFVLAESMGALVIMKSIIIINTFTKCC